MNENEQKIAAAIAEIEQRLRPMAATHDDEHLINGSLDTLKEQLIKAVGRRVIKGTK